MILTFYDKNFVALQDNASLNVGDWELKRNAVDFDDFSATSEAFIENINPTFVVLKDDRGRYKYGAFAGVPQLNKKNQTTLQSTDLKGYFDNEILIQYPNCSTVKDLFDFAISEFKLQVNQNSFSVDFDDSCCEDITLTQLKPAVTQEYEIVNVWEDIFVPYMKFYNLCMESELNIPEKKLVYKVGKINQYVRQLNLYEYGIQNYGKWIASVNECELKLITPSSVSSKSFVLTSNNEITDDLSMRDLFPIKKRYVLKETEDENEAATLLIEGIAETVEKLADARYNESIELDVNNTPFEQATFNYCFQVYVNKGSSYKLLPVGSIKENNKGKKTITIGYKPEDIVLYIGGSK